MCATVCPEPGAVLRHARADRAAAAASRADEPASSSASRRSPRGVNMMVPRRLRRAARHFGRRHGRRWSERPRDAWPSASCRAIDTTGSVRRGRGPACPTRHRTTDEMSPSRARTDAPDGRRSQRWRRDFPIDWPQDHYVARRDFVKFMVLTSVAFTIGQVWIGAQNWWRRRRSDPPLARIAALSELAVGSSAPSSPTRQSTTPASSSAQRDDGSSPTARSARTCRARSSRGSTRG